MAIKIKNSFVEENIEDEKGNILGILRFNPNDTRIVSRLTKCAENAEKALKELKKIGNISDLSSVNIESIEDAEKISDDISKMNQALEIEEKIITNTLSELEEIFGKETVDLFTQGTKDIESIMPILDFAMPYVKKARQNKVNKYNAKNKSNVME